MSEDPDDLELRPDRDPSDPELSDLLGPPPSASRAAWAWILGGLGLLLAAGALVWLRRDAPGPPPPAAPPPIATTPTAPPAPSSVEPLPPLDGSDAVVREIARGLSGHPLAALWLAQTQLARAFTAVVANVAEGESPRAHLPFLAPRSAFGVLESRGRLVVDPQSYARYDAVADAVEALDAEACARVLRRLEPLFEAAYRELGHPGGGFGKALETAFARLLEVPRLEGEVPLVEMRKAVVVYAYADPRLEKDLSVPQKHLLRMGPRNVRRIQDKLRAVAAALAAGPSPGPQ